MFRRLLRPCSTYSKLSTDYLVSNKELKCVPWIICLFDFLFQSYLSVFWCFVPQLFGSWVTIAADWSNPSAYTSRRFYMPIWPYWCKEVWYRYVSEQCCQLLSKIDFENILQALGCIAALKLSERLLNIYWISLLVLLIGDIFVGGMWMIRFDSLTENLSEDLYSKLR